MLEEYIDSKRFGLHWDREDIDLETSSAQFSPYARELLSMIPKIKICAIDISKLDFKSKLKLYYVNKDEVHFPMQPSLNHEIAHMVEIPENRVLLTDWGLTVNNFHTHSYDAKARAFCREARVIAIEAILDRNVLGARNYIARIMNFVPHHIKTRDPNKLNRYTSEYAGHLFESTLKHWDHDRIRDVWKKKAEIINNYQEIANE